MRTVGRRKERPITFSASAALLLEGACFNDDIHRLPSGKLTSVRKGVYRFISHEEAHRQQMECLVEGMARAALERL